LLGYINGQSRKSLAIDYKCTRSNISQILRSQGVNSVKELTLRDKQIVDLLAKGYDRHQVAAQTDVTLGVIDHIRDRHGYNWIPLVLDCNICGEEFTQTDPRQGICSPECRKIYRHRFTTERQKRRAWRVCELCGKRYPVTGAKYRQRFCGRTCGNIDSSKKNALRNKEIVYLRDVQGLTWVRIGEIFNIPRWTVTYGYKKQQRLNSDRLHELLAK
jgi:predicted nucleic acid-binding Zn ribbon protein